MVCRKILKFIGRFDHITRNKQILKDQRSGAKMCANFSQVFMSKKLLTSKY